MSDFDMDLNRVLDHIRAQENLPGMPVEAKKAARSLVKAVKDFVPLMREGKLVIDKPRILRTFKQTSYIHAERYIVVQAAVHYKDALHDVSCLPDLGLVEDEGCTGIWRPASFPHMLSRTWDLSNYYHSIFNSVGSEGQFVSLLSLAGGDNWVHVREAVAAEARRIYLNRVALVEESMVKTSGRERKALQKKFARALEGAGDLVDADPEAVMKFFKIGWADLKLLSRFVKRNSADVAIVEVEDIVEAQNLARVGKVMKA